MKGKLRSQFFTSVALISFGAMGAKVIGAFYRIPLSGALGGYGMGLYQMAYPLFCVLLTLSSAGIPNAFSRVIAGEKAFGRRTENTVQAALKLFGSFGAFGAILLCLIAPVYAQVQGNTSLARCYYALAPALPFVSLIAVLRGYFQGKNQMLPTALSEIVESAVKAGVGLCLALRFQNSPDRAVFYALLAVTLSEGVALSYLFLRYRGEEKSRFLPVKSYGGGNLLSVTLPVTLAAVILPFSKMLDSVIVVRLLLKTQPNAVTLYGLFTGGALSLVALPASLCYGLASASVPAVSSCFAKGEYAEGRKRALYSLSVTLILSAVCAVALFFGAKPAVRILYRSLDFEQRETLVNLVKASSFAALPLAGIDTLSACLTAMGRAKRAVFSMACAVTVKTALQICLLAGTSLSIYAAVISESVCYLVAFFLDLRYTMLNENKRKKSYDHHRRIRGRKRGFHFGGALRRAQSEKGSRS